MFKNKLGNILRLACKLPKTVMPKVKRITPLTVGLLSAAYCDEKQSTAYCDDCDEKQTELNYSDQSRLGHEFFIQQATTVNVNAATQLLTVTMVAIHDTSERLRQALTREICLVKQALEWGENGTPPQHWDELIAVRGLLRDLKQNLHNLLSYMDYAGKLATVAAEISYLSGNVAASEAICERIDHACRACNTQKELTQELQQESLRLQQLAIINSPQLEQQLKSE